MITAAEALMRLREGNQRFVAGTSQSDTDNTAQRRTELVDFGQQPFAIILGCSDSRVPVETVFDQGLGQLFVIRVAGNIAATTQIGSIEFAVQQFGSRLIVVLGHSHCGAIRATLDEYQRPSTNLSPSLRAIVEHVQPGLRKLLESDNHDQSESVLEQAIRANISANVDQLQNGSEIIAAGINAGEISVVGAEYSLASGQVTFFSEAG